MVLHVGTVVLHIFLHYNAESPEGEEDFLMQKRK
jgi:hypothetical protein